MVTAQRRNRRQWLTRRALHEEYDKIPGVWRFENIDSGKVHRLRGLGASVFKCGRPNSRMYKEWQGPESQDAMCK
eukprot:851584-Karenia_brevis.AAC.1